jgi:hypothetical protein
MKFLDFACPSLIFFQILPTSNWRSEIVRTLSKRQIWYKAGLLGSLGYGNILVGEEIETRLMKLCPYYSKCVYRYIFEAIFF